MQIQNPCKKLCEQSALLFLIFHQEDCQNLNWKCWSGQNCSFVRNWPYLGFWPQFWLSSWKNIKKRRALSSHNFLRGFWICSQIYKILILKFWPKNSFDPILAVWFLFSDIWSSRKAARMSTFWWNKLFWEVWYIEYSQSRNIKIHVINCHVRGS